MDFPDTKETGLAPRPRSSLRVRPFFVFFFSLSLFFFFSCPPRLLCKVLFLHEQGEERKKKKVTSFPAVSLLVPDLVLGRAPARPRVYSRLCCCERLISRSIGRFLPRQRICAQKTLTVASTGRRLSFPLPVPAASHENSTESQPALLLLLLPPPPPSSLLLLLLLPPFVPFPPSLGLVATKGLGTGAHLESQNVLNKPFLGISSAAISL